MDQPSDRLLDLLVWLHIRMETTHMATGSNQNTPTHSVRVGVRAHVGSGEPGAFYWGPILAAVEDEIYSCHGLQIRNSCSAPEYFLLHI